MSVDCASDAGLNVICAYVTAITYPSITEFTHTYIYVSPKLADNITQFVAI